MDTEKDFLQALAAFKPDLIVSDYQMPTFDGLSALQLARDKAPFTPFIILTGSMNEDVAVDCMKAGADDYVIKEHIQRLGQSVLSAFNKKKVEQEHHRAMKEIQDQRLRLRELASELTLTEERLKRTVASELHDRVSQCLAIAKMNLASLLEHVIDPSLEQTLTSISEQLGIALDETRSLTSRLSYPILNILGLAKAIDMWLKEEIRSKHGLDTHFSEDSLNKALDEDVRAVLFRSVREVLNNIVKHARARRVDVTVEHNIDKLVVRVRDDGIGFDPQTTGIKGDGFGLLSIQESLGRLGGCFEIESEKGSGCTIILSVPVLAEEQVEVASP